MKSGRIVACALVVVLALLTFALLQTSQVVAQGGRATATPARLPTRTATPTPPVTPTPTVTVTATTTATGTPGLLLPTPTPPAFVLLPAPSVKNQLAGDIVTAPGLLLSGAWPSVFGDRVAFAMANLRDTSTNATGGAGIYQVTFTIIDTLTGEAVHSHVAKGSLCAFQATGGGCPVFDLAANNDKWPQGAAAHSGHYLLIAFAEGAVSDHKGTWTLPFELRRARDGLQKLDGAARIVDIARDPGGALVTVETFGFAPLAAGTHLHLYGAASAQAGAQGPSGTFVEFPSDRADMNVGDWSGNVRVLVPAAALGDAARVLCVAVAHPDHTLLPGRGECLALDY